MCPLRPEEHGTERPLQNCYAVLVAGFVEADCFLGGQSAAPALAKTSPAFLRPIRCTDGMAETAPLRRLAEPWKPLPYLEL
jgi:hypothetical protein